MLTSGSMTAALDRLERRGLIERMGDESDRRIRMIRLTKAGTALIREAFEDHKQVMEQAVDGIEKKDRLVAIDLLRQLGLHAFQQFAGNGEKDVVVKKGRRK
jgi:MarR family 2-MHQ and catechol resistance regulon transcriptional repressor